MCCHGVGSLAGLLPTDLDLDYEDGAGDREKALKRPKQVGTLHSRRLHSLPDYRQQGARLSAPTHGPLWRIEWAAAPAPHRHWDRIGLGLGWTVLRLHCSSSGTSCRPTRLALT